MKEKFKGVIQAKKGTIIKVGDLVGFSMPGDEDVYISKNVIDTEICDSTKVQVNHGTLKAGKSLLGGTHDCPYNEIYYILRGRAKLTLGEEECEVGPDTTVYIPCGTYHRLDNTNGDTDLEIISIWHLPLKEGANEIYDARKKAWGGSSFKKVGE